MIPTISAFKTLIEVEPELISLIPEEKQYRFVTTLAGRKWLAYRNPNYQEKIVMIAEVEKFLSNGKISHTELREQFFGENSLAKTKDRTWAKDFFSSEGGAIIKEAIEALIPWRKGPYQLGVFEIDSEWNSALKWQRLKPYLGDLTDKVICDLGANNGYFSLRILEYSTLETKTLPRHIVMMEPVENYYFQYLLLRQFGWRGYDRRLSFELAGYQELSLFPMVFDLLFCLGILYHHPEPINILRLVHQSLKPGGIVIIDCQGIQVGNNGDTLQQNSFPLALFPESTYLGKKGFWFLPNLEQLQHWLKRSGFSSIEVLFREELSVREQRRSRDAPFASLSEGMEDGRTIEGYPPPMRYYLKAVKG